MTQKPLSSDEVDCDKQWKSRRTGRTTTILGVEEGFVYFAFDDVSNAITTCTIKNWKEDFINY